MLDRQTSFQAIIYLVIFAKRGIELEIPVIGTCQRNPNAMPRLEIPADWYQVDRQLQNREVPSWKSEPFAYLRFHWQFK